MNMSLDSSSSLISSDRVEGTKVYSRGGKQIGTVDHLMIEKVSGRVAYAVMTFGGFLGLGEKRYPVPWGTLEYNTAREGYDADITEEQLRDAPEYEQDQRIDRGWEGRVHDHYRVPYYWDRGL